MTSDMRRGGCRMERRPGEPPVPQHISLWGLRCCCVIVLFLGVAVVSVAVLFCGASPRALRVLMLELFLLQVLVSHDFRLISQVANEIYEVNKVRGMVPFAEFS